MKAGSWGVLKKRGAGALAVLSVAALAGAASGPYLSASSAEPMFTPEIRITPLNRVPQCVTPERLMAFLATRNRALDPRFQRIAEAYRHYGEAWRVRWDYAFFQMAVETNFLTYRQPNGKMGDVDPQQNNFAGIGTTGGGVPGDRFPDVNTGVLGQIQHLVAYSGEYVAEPVAQRTRLKQADILRRSHELMRPVRFSDLAKRWAADPRYGRTIEFVAESYRQMFCRGGMKPWANPDQAMVPKPIQAPQPVPRARPAELAPWQVPQVVPPQPQPYQQQPLPKPQPGLRPPLGMLTTGSIDRVEPVIVKTVWRRVETVPAAAVAAEPPAETPLQSEPDSGGFALFKAPEWLATVKPEAPLPPPSALGGAP